MSRLPVEGESFGRYRLFRQLGEGGMGVVYVARDEVLNRWVALKLVLPRHAADPDFRSRFAREAETQARLESSHVVRIYDYGDQDGVLFLCTQYVEGGDLAARVAASGALAPALAIEVVSQVLAGLEEAHDAGVVHRDVKPANVLLRPKGDGVQAYLCDFGIAIMGGQGLTRTGQVIGSLAWMAPERHYGKEPGPVGDLYAAGCLLWYALTGAAPYTGSDGEVLMGHIEGAVPQLPGRSAFAKRMNAVLTKALAKRPEDRYATAAAMAADLRALAPLAPGEVRMEDATVIRSSIAAVGPKSVRTKAATSPAASARPTVKRRPGWVLSLLVAASVLVLVGGGLAVEAALDDDPALVDQTTQVAASGGPVSVAPQPHLRLRKGSRGGAGATMAPSGIPAPIPETPRATSAGGGTGVVVPKLPASGTQAPPRAQVAPTAAAPTYRYRCWDSATHLTNDLAACGDPVGLTGARWIYSNFGARGCTTSSIPAGEARIKELFSCKFGTNGVGTLSIYRFAGQADARSYLGERLSGTAPDTWSRWSVGAQSCGYQAKGEQTFQGTTTKRFVSYYNNGTGLTWGFLVAAPTADGRDWGVTNLISRYARVLPEFRGQAL